MFLVVQRHGLYWPYDTNSREKGGNNLLDLRQRIIHNVSVTRGDGVSQSVFAPYPLACETTELSVILLTTGCFV